MAKVLRIAKWKQTFEKSDSRKCSNATWISVPNNTKSSGMVTMFEDFGDRQPLIYGAWIFLCLEASKAPYRGVLASSRGKPYTISRLAEAGFTAELMAELIDWAKDSNVCWLEELEFEDAIRMDPLPPKPEPKPESSGSDTPTPTTTLAPTLDDFATTETTTPIPTTDIQTEQTDKHLPLPPSVDSNGAPERQPDWEEGEGALGVALRRREVNAVQACLDAARAAGLSPTDVKAIIAEYDAAPGFWSPGALYERIAGKLAGWPPPAPEAVKQQARADSERREAEKQAKQAEEVRKLAEADARREAYLARLEAAHGADLDVLDKNGIRDLATRLQVPKLYIQRWNKHACKLPLDADDVFRQLLLEGLQAGLVSTP